MSFPPQARKADEKLGLILGRIGSIRTRLNSIAWQRGAFGVLAWLVAIGALVVLAAYYLQPLTFLLLATVLATVALAGIFNSVRAAWRLHVNRGAAASIADRRADLKGRLETIVEIGQRRNVVRLGQAPESLLLWSYLIEDTLSRQEEFAPARIETRRISRSIYGFLAALLIAALTVPLIARVHNKPVPIPPGEDEVTMDLDDLHLRAADSDSDDAVEVHADARTMRRLEDKLAAEGVAGHGKSSDTPMDKMVNHAKDLAGRLQDKLTGRANQKSRLTLKLADNSQQMGSFEKHDLPKLNPHRQGEDADAHFEREKTNGDSSFPNADKMVTNDPEKNSIGGGNGDESDTRQQHVETPDSASDKSADQANGDQSSNGGFAHGIGADPDTLFGNPSDPKMGGQGFEISIDARSDSKGPEAAGHAYLPPKVRTPLATNQHPDEPIARSSVPDDDRLAIKKVFER